MFRVVKIPAVVPAGVDTEIDGQVITIKGKNGELTRTLNDVAEVRHADNTLTFGPRDGYADGRAQAGTARTLLNSIVIGVTEGFTKKLWLVGIGYRAAVEGSVINLSLSFPHPVGHQLPAGITIECPTQTEIVLKDTDKRVTGQVAADLHAYRRPESYKGKGIHYANEVVHTKETKKKWGNTTGKESARIRHATRTRRKLQELGVTRLAIHHTPRRIYAQIIVPNGSEVLIAASTVEKAITEQLKYTGNKDAAVAVDKAAAERALGRGVEDISLDHSRFQYHGRVQTLTNVAREVNLQF